MSGLFFVVDQLAKWFAVAHPNATYYLIQPWLGWELFRNPGIAFGIPLPQIIVIPLTVLILVGGLVYIAKKEQRTAHMILGTSLIIFGALSNLVDRLVYGETIDYIRIVTSVINLADVMIVVGAGVVLFWKKGSTPSS